MYYRVRMDHIKDMVTWWVCVRCESEGDGDSQDRVVRVRKLVIETMSPVSEWVTRTMRSMKEWVIGTMRPMRLRDEMIVMIHPIRLWDKEDDVTCEGSEDYMRVIYIRWEFSILPLDLNDDITPITFEGIFDII